MKIGDTVVKISKKPFQNGMREAIVVSFGEMTIPVNHTKVGNKTVACVFLKDCTGPVRQDILEVK